MLASWVVGVLALCACVAYGKEEEEFNVFSALRKSNFSVNLRELVWADCNIMYIVVYSLLLHIVSQLTLLRLATNDL